MKKRQSELKLVMRPLPHPSDSQMGLSCGISCQALPRRRRSRMPALSPRILALGCTTTTTLHGYESKLDPGGVSCAILAHRGTSFSSKHS